MVSCQPAAVGLQSLSIALNNVGITNQKNVFVNEGELGSVEVHMDGRLYYNGQPLFDEHEAQIRKACENLLKKE